MVLSLYPAIFYREQNGTVSVIFPDLNHLATGGENLQEAMEMAIDCLAGYIHSAKQDGESLPEPTPVEEVDIHCEDDEDEQPDYESAFVSLVAVDVEDYADKYFEKPVKKTLTIPDWLNEAAVDMNINFSAVLKNRLAFLCSKQSESKIPNAANSDLYHGKKAKLVKKTLTLPKWLNERALAMNMNFSAVLRDVLLELCRDKFDSRNI